MFVQCWFDSIGFSVCYKEILLTLNFRLFCSHHFSYRRIFNESEKGKHQITQYQKDMHSMIYLVFICIRHEKYITNFPLFILNHTNSKNVMKNMLQSKWKSNVSPGSSFLFFDTILWTEIIMIIFTRCCFGVTVKYQFTKEIPHSVVHLWILFRIVRVSKALYYCIHSNGALQRKWSDICFESHFR